MRAAVTFRGAMRPQQGGSDGRCMLDVTHRVELRCGRAQRPDGSWADAWRLDSSHRRVEFANHAAELLRASGHTVRVRPVIL
jgi:hypothetical protein